MVSVIEAARVLSAYTADSLKRTVRFIAFGTEEIGLTGAFRYVNTHADELDNVRFMLNMDAAGGASRKGIVLHQWQKLQPFFEEAAGQLNAEVPVGQKVHSYSDHFPFFPERRALWSYRRPGCTTLRQGIRTYCLRYVGESQIGKLTRRKCCRRTHRTSVRERR